MYTTAAEAAEHFSNMERRLLRSAMNPAMALAFITGILLIIATKAGAPGTGYWIHAKLLLILLLGAAHGVMSASRKRLERGENEKSEGFSASSPKRLPSLWSSSCS